MFVYKKRMHKKLSLGVAFTAALIFGDSLFAQNVGGVIKGVPTQQSQSQQSEYQPQGSQSINQNGRLLLELQALKQELASLRNQVEQQGYQLRKLQSGQGQPDNVQSSGQLSSNNSAYGNSNTLVAGEISSNGTNNQQQFPDQSNTASANTSSSASGGVNFPLLPQDQIAGQVRAEQQQAVPQLLSESSQLPVQQSQFQQQPQFQQPTQNPQLSAQRQLLEEGDKGIKTNLNELELYNKGIDELSSQDYKSAASIFSSQLQNFPKGEKAGDGYFWLAETFYILDDLDSSAKSYQSLVDLFPRHVRTPKALLKLIAVHQGRNDNISAKIAMNDLVKKYPSSEESASAKSQYPALL